MGRFRWLAVSCCLIVVQGACSLQLKMISYGLFVIWFGLFCYQAYKWMFHRPDNFPPGKRSYSIRVSNIIRENSSFCFVYSVNVVDLLTYSVKYRLFFIFEQN